MSIGVIIFKYSIYLQIITFVTDWFLTKLSYLVVLMSPVIARKPKKKTALVVFIFLNVLELGIETCKLLWLATIMRYIDRVEGALPFFSRELCANCRSQRYLSIILLCHKSIFCDNRRGGIISGCYSHMSSCRQKAQSVFQHQSFIFYIAFASF